MDETWFLPLPVQILILLVFAFAFGFGIWKAIRSAAANLMPGMGWQSLAARYAATAPGPGNCLEKQTILVGAVRYWNCISFGISDAGLYLAPSGMGRITQNRPLLIPWQAISGIGQARLYWQKAAVLVIGSPPVGRITLPRDLFDLVRDRLSPELRRTAPV